MPTVCRRYRTFFNVVKFNGSAIICSQAKLPALEMQMALAQIIEGKSFVRDTFECSSCNVDLLHILLKQ
jgi:hypothetical protein